MEEAAERVLVVDGLRHLELGRAKRLEQSHVRLVLSRAAPKVLDDAGRQRPLCGKVRHGAGKVDQEAVAGPCQRDQQHPQVDEEALLKDATVDKFLHQFVETVPVYA